MTKEELPPGFFIHFLNYKSPKNLILGEFNSNQIKIYFQQFDYILIIKSFNN